MKMIITDGMIFIISSCQMIFIHNRAKILAASSEWNR
jgi:oligoribonuclease (3'-5' exoribonuclease)